ncbi:hypothetical protein KCH_76790 [Kitasatospora cheerisanensis KCTC 2395]|uniref:Uncharacterized protein n=1 Tax=Kitasatospora cheerisanensis KCTC 2395 TaxID=1348663 RepID=A0A066YHB2_9ACTN|nr:hypothetical protein KCH_76790 [Kitasatospora cheerisanensis KCTC 2395]
MQAVVEQGPTCSSIPKTSWLPPVDRRDGRGSDRRNNGATGRPLRRSWRSRTADRSTPPRWF